MAILRLGPVLRSWPPRRWLVAAGSALLFAVVVAVPTDLVDTPVFGREVPPTWWSWPGLVVSALLAGLLTATYVAPVQGAGRTGADDTPAARRGGYAGALLTFFAVGCPVCNKLVLLALGSAGAMTWFEPVQPLLQVAAIGLLSWALSRRVSGEVACRVPRVPSVPRAPTGS